MALLDKTNETRQSLISSHILGIPRPENARNNSEWVAKMEHVLPMIPAGEILALHALKTIASNNSFAVIDSVIPELPPDISQQLDLCLAGNDFREVRATLKEQLSSTESDQFDSKSLPGFLTIASEETSILTATVRSMLSNPESKSEWWKTAITSTRQRIQEIYNLKHKAEQSREKLEAAIEHENSVKDQQIHSQNHKRVAITLPDLLNNPDVETIYTQRYRIATNLAQLYILYCNSGSTVSKAEYSSMFSLLRKHLPEMAKSYQPLPDSSEKFHVDDYHNLLLYLMHATTLSFDYPIEETRYADLEKDLGFFIDNEILQHTIDGSDNLATDMLDQLRTNELHGRRQEEPSPIELLMLSIWQPGEGKPKLDVNYYRYIVQPLVFPDNKAPNKDHLHLARLFLTRT